MPHRPSLPEEVPAPVQVHPELAEPLVLTRAQPALSGLVVELVLLVNQLGCAAQDLAILYAFLLVCLVRGAVTTVLLTESGRPSATVGLGGR